MATVRQIQANRANAQKSTGPRTPEGKAVTCLNALKSGIHAEAEIIPGKEFKEELDALREEFYGQFQPATPEERSLG